MSIASQKWTDLAVFGGAPAFPEALHVGLPNIGNQSRLLQRIEGVLSRRWLTNGPLVMEFERRVAELTEVRHCVAVSNATTGLEVLYRALGLSGEVIVPSFTFIATAQSLAWVNLTPVFCDVDPRTHNIDPDRVEALITPRTTAITGVHLWGRLCDTDRLAAIARKHRIRLVFDAAHAFGSGHPGAMTGGFGDAEVFSFHATKFINTLEGGAVTTNDAVLAARCRALRDFGFSPEDEVLDVGTNGKMSEFSAAMGLTALESMGEYLAANYATFARYQEELSGHPGIRFLTFDESASRFNHQYVVIEIDDSIAGISRDEVLKVLTEENVLAKRYFHPGCHRTPVFESRFAASGRTLPVTDRLARTVLVLPGGASVGPEKASAVSALLRRLVEDGPLIREKLAARNQRIEEQFQVRA